MRTDILSYLRQELDQRCQSSSNYFGYSCFRHIEAVVKNAALLAEVYHADKEICMIAAWLHDIASVTDYALYPEHHIHGAKMAEDILSRFHYDEERTALVKRCIQNHRGSVKSERLTPEEQCVADADAVSHFDNIPSLFYLAYVTKGLDIEEGKEFVKAKLLRSFQKLSEAGKTYYKNNCQLIQTIFS